MPRRTSTRHALLAALTAVVLICLGSGAAERSDGTTTERVAASRASARVGGGPDTVPPAPHARLDGAGPRLAPHAPPWGTGPDQLGAGGGHPDCRGHLDHPAVGPFVRALTVPVPGGTAAVTQPAPQTDPLRAAVRTRAPPVVA